MKRIKSLHDLNIEIERQHTRLNTTAAELVEIESVIRSRSEEREKLEKAIEMALVERQSAEELAKTTLELETVRRKSEFEAKLQAQLQELEANNPKAQLEAELRDINTKIEQARQVLLIQQEQYRSAAELEDFIAFHSISLTPQDIKDIELIRQFSPQLSRQEAFFKLIWTEFYQKPIQLLCKTLATEKLRGVYKITNTTNQRMYIGQAVDIAARWKEHCKIGLGIGSTSYKTNKFYKALHDEGIENFTFEVLEAGEIDLNEREAYWINFYNATAFGYNSKIGG